MASDLAKIFKEQPVPDISDLEHARLTEPRKNKTGGGFTIPIADSRDPANRDCFCHDISGIAAFKGELSEQGSLSIAMKPGNPEWFNYFDIWSNRLHELSCIKAVYELLGVKGLKQAEMESNFNSFVKRPEGYEPHLKIKAFEGKNGTRVLEVNVEKGKIVGRSAKITDIQYGARLFVQFQHHSVWYSSSRMWGDKLFAKEVWFTNTGGSADDEALTSRMSERAGVSIAFSTKKRSLEEVSPKSEKEEEEEGKPPAKKVRFNPPSAVGGFQM